MVGRADDCTVDHHRPGLERTHAQDRGLGIVDHRHPFVEAQRPEI